ncbi:hypothetical protein HGA88_04810 [Candidatus Roizmanbacteria bacterium]|nr:hypothetical protein [Candidatus Roizmanbacteria bacterium]
MEQHQIPRQITTFEFKLIGFMTLKQFLYLIIFFPAAYIVFSLFPIPLLNVLLAIVVAGSGIAIAFLPIQDRPIDVWLKNLYKRLTSPTQYTYHKNNQPLYFLQGLYFLTDPHKIMAQVETKEKLHAYLAQTTKAHPASKQKQQIHGLLQKPADQLHQIPSLQPVVPAPVSPPTLPTQPEITNATPLPPEVQPVQTVLAAPPTTPTKPFFVGVVKNNRNIPLPGILIYIKDGQNKSLRLLKSNPHGLFATFNPLPAGEYTIEIKDPKGGYFFDTMKTRIENENPRPLELVSKEML